MSGPASANKVHDDEVELEPKCRTASSTRSIWKLMHILVLADTANTIVCR